MECEKEGTLSGARVGSLPVRKVSFARIIPSGRLGLLQVRTAHRRITKGRRGNPDGTPGMRPLFFASFYCSLRRRFGRRFYTRFYIWRVRAGLLQSYVAAEKARPLELGGVGSLARAFGEFRPWAVSARWLKMVKT